MKQLYVLFSLISILSCAAAQDKRTLGIEAIERGETSRAYQLLLPFAQRGDPQAQEAVALLLGSESDIGVSLPRQKRDRIARKWLIRSVYNGHLSAAKWIAYGLESGWAGFKKNEVGSLCWKRVDQGEIRQRDCEKFIQD
jgi:TPR repeat protein